MSESTVATICAELHDRSEVFCRRTLYDVKLVALFLDAIYLPVRPHGPKEGVMCAWGITETGDQRAGIGAPGDARVQGGLARARPRPHRPWTHSAEAGGSRRRPGLDRGG